MITTRTRKHLEAILLEEGLVSQEHLDQVTASFEGPPSAVGQALVDQRVITEVQLAYATAQQYGLPYQPLTDFRIDPRFYQTISVELMHRHPFVPVEERDGVLTVAIPDPHNQLGLDEIELLLDRPLQFVVSARGQIHTALGRSEGASQALKELETEYRSVLIKEDDRGEEVLSVERITQDQSPIVKLVDTILLSALQRRASDIHIEGTARSTMVRLRVDGILLPALEPLDVKLHAPLVSRLKVMSDLDIAERRVPQDGRFRMRLDRRTVDFRVSIVPSVFGESVVIRILDRESMSAGLTALRLDKMGFNPEDLRKFRLAIGQPYGMVLVTGPTGSGKTTSLYAAISEINTNEDKVITIEDPVEYQLPGVVQIPVNEKKGLTFARGLRSILRHDPDKIMVGEIRDLETAQIAIQSALTGHLVFTTVHANNVFDVIGRFVNMGIEPYNFVSSLNCILAQRLVRLSCLSCREQITLDKTMAEESGLDYQQFKDIPLYQGRGCRECLGTGFRGRECITEFLEFTEDIKEMVLSRQPNSDILARALAAGMITLRQSGIRKVLRGVTTFREINRVSSVEKTR